MIFCLPKDIANKLREAIGRGGNLDPKNLSKMTSAERRNALAEIVGEEYAKDINLEFEKKLLLKNQEKAMDDWIDDTLGLNKEEKEAMRAKIKETYAEKRRRLEDPRENEVFLSEIISDVYSRKYKEEVSLEEAENIIRLTQRARQTRAKMKDDFTWATEQDGIDFGAAEVALKNYLLALKAKAMRDTLINPLHVRNASELADMLTHNANLSFEVIASTARTLITSLDNSLWGRQGIKAFFNHNAIWRKHFVESFRDINRVIRQGVPEGDLIVSAARADAFRSKNYLNGRYNLGTKLDLEVKEEDILTDNISRVPVLGRAFKAANVAFEAGAIRLRKDLADKVYNLAERSGVDMTSKHEVGSINMFVNSMTGRGHLGQLERAGQAVNMVFFSAKFFKSNLDTLTAHLVDGRKTSSFVKKQAGMNLLRIISGIGLILLMVDALDDEAVEWDPRSADFGKIKLGDMRFDITGGMSGLVILAARLATGSTKSSTTGLIREFRDGFAAPSGMDVLWNFTENRFSPMFSTIRNIINQETFEGEDLTVMHILKDMVVPITWQGTYDAYEKEGLSNALLVLLGESLGVSANVYTYSKNWNERTGKRLMRFKEKVGQQVFDEANKEFNRRIEANLKRLRETEMWGKMSDEDRLKALTRENKKIEEEVLREFITR